MKIDVPKRALWTPKPGAGGWKGDVDLRMLSSRLVSWGLWGTSGLDPQGLFLR